MNPYFIYSEHIQIKWYSVFIILGLFISLIWAIREGKRFSLDKEFIINVFFWTIIIGVVGARAYYVIFNLDYYLNNLSEIYKFWFGGIAIHGGIIFGMFTIIFYCRKYKVSALRFMDIIAPCILLSQAIGRWGNFFNGEAYGTLTTLARLKNMHLPEFIIEGMKINGSYYTPTFLYESLWCVLGVIILIIIRRIKYMKVGYQTGFYLMWYSVGRFYIESLRTDSLMMNDVKVAQIVSVLLFIVGFIIILSQYKKPKLEELYNDTSTKIIPKNFK